MLIEEFSQLVHGQGDVLVLVVKINMCRALSVDVPTEGLMIGERLAWYNDRILMVPGA